MELIIINSKALGTKDMVEKIEAEFLLVKEKLAACNITFRPVRLQFNSRMRTTGGRAWTGEKRLIELNLRLMRENPEELLPTFVHELIHIVTRDCHGPKVASHGFEWKQMMRRVGQTPDRCHTMPTEHLKAQRKTWNAKCKCMTHEIGAKRKRNMETGSKYTCRMCKAPLQLETASSSTNILDKLRGSR